MRVVTQDRAKDFGCVHHAARLLASLAGSRVYPGPGAPETAAIEAFNRAQTIEPFAWTRNHEPTTGKEG